MSKIIGDSIAIACPAVESGQVYTIVMLGVSCGILALILHVVNKKFSNKTVNLIKYLLLAIFIFYSLEINSTSCSAPSAGFKLKTLPHSIIPFSSEEPPY